VAGVAADIWRPPGGRIVPSIFRHLRRAPRSLKSTRRGEGEKGRRRHPLEAPALAVFGAVLWLLATDSAVGSLSLATAILSRFPSCYGGCGASGGSTGHETQAFNVVARVVGAARGLTLP
jgi:hypothetical protein